MGVSVGVLPFIAALPSLGFVSSPIARKRLIILFSPNGVVGSEFWPDETTGESMKFKRILAPLSPFKKQTLLLNGISDKVAGDGDNHMRGIGCLLTGRELFPGNIQGMFDTAAGWASGISIDQELKNHFQASDKTRTRFGSIELGVAVPQRADPWTRMSYAGPNKPVAPTSDPYQAFEKLYGRGREKETLGSILDDLRDDFRKVAAHLSEEDRKLLDDHLTLVREMERDLQDSESERAGHFVPPLDPGVMNDNDHIPRISRMQIDILVSAFTNDMARVATLQYTNSVGQARMRWLGINEGHHALSHDGDSNAESQEKLVKINTWFCEEVAYLCQKLSETREPGGAGSLLDNTLVVWTNELGKGNSHSLDNIPFVLIGGGWGFEMGRCLKFDQVAHNRLWLSLTRSAGSEIETFGNPNLCHGGPLSLG